MNHSELGDTYLTLLEAVKQTGLSEAEVVLHSEEVWMYCPQVPKDKKWQSTLRGMGTLPGLGRGKSLEKIEVCPFVQN